MDMVLSIIIGVSLAACCGFRVFVPLLVYDERGYRAGYGKGFYDRYLQLCKDDVIKIGFSYFAPEPLISDVNEFDIPLNFVITPERIYEF